MSGQFFETPPHTSSVLVQAPGSPMSHRMRFQSLDFQRPSKLSEAEDVSLSHGKEQNVIAMHDMPAICGSGNGDDGSKSQTIH